MNKVFPQFRGKTLDNYVPLHESQLAAKEATQDYIEHLAANQELGRGLTYLGPVGVGKSMLASMVMGAAQEAGCRIECVQLSSYVQLIKNSWEASALARLDYEDEYDRLVKIRERLHNVKTAHFLLLDDVGREYPSESGWSSQQLFDLIKYRYTYNRPTLVTSNLRWEQFDDRYTEGLTSLLGVSPVVALMGDDFRVTMSQETKWNTDS